MQLLAEPIETALQLLHDRISYLEATIAQLKEENAALAATQAHLIENQEIQLQLIKQLREAAKREPQPIQKDRAEVLMVLIAANGGKMLAKDARQKMHLSKQLFSMPGPQWANALRLSHYIAIIEKGGPDPQDFLNSSIESLTNSEVFSGCLRNCDGSRAGEFTRFIDTDLSEIEMDSEQNILK